MIIKADIGQKHHSDIFEEHIAKITFGPVPDKLDKWTETCLGLVSYHFKRTGIQMGDIEIIDPKRPDLPSRIFKLPHKDIKYMDVLPIQETFLFVPDDEHHESIHPDQALLLLFGKPGKAVITEQGSILTIEGVTIVDPRTGDDRIRQAKKCRQRNKGGKE